MDRRQMIKVGSAAILGGALPFQGCSFSISNGKERRKKEKIRIAINMSTISGYKLPIEQQIEFCAEAGYDGIELWIRDVQDYVKHGGNIDVLANRIKDSGLRIENMIGFAAWMTGCKGMDEMKREMELSSRLGSPYIAATCFGLTSLDQFQKSVYAENYRKLLDFGEEMGTIPLLELWGHRVLSKLTDIIDIALGACHKKAGLLLDFYHLYRGGNSFNNLALLSGKAMPVFHINDYPGNILREDLKDSDRVLPGDGICPFQEILPILFNIGFSGTFSLELFNPEYWRKYTIQELLKRGKESITLLLDNLM